MSFAGRVFSSGKGAPFVILAVSLSLMAPALIHPGATVHGDFFAYTRWQAHFSRAFGGGDLYPPLGQWLGALLAPLLPGAEAAGLRLTLVLTACLG